MDEACPVSSKKRVAAKRRKCEFTEMKHGSGTSSSSITPIKQYAVKCDVCGVIVGAKQEKSDVIHFTHVLSSHA